MDAQQSTVVLFLIYQLYILEPFSFKFYMDRFKIIYWKD